MLTTPRETDLVYFVRRLIRQGDVRRAKRLAKTLTDPVMRQTAVGLTDLASGRERAAGLALRQALRLDRLALEGKTCIKLRSYRMPHHLDRDVDLIGTALVSTFIDRFVDVAHASCMDEFDDFESVSENKTTFQGFIIRWHERYRLIVRLTVIVS